MSHDVLLEAVTFCKNNEITELSFERYDREYLSKVVISYEGEENSEEGEEDVTEENIV